mgnify:CR=1 FL=1
MSNPIYFSDGNYAVEQEQGVGEWTYPFFDKGDGTSFELKLKYRIDSGYYKPSKPMERVKTDRGYAYLVEQSEASHIGNGILEYTKTFISIPIARKEYGQINYTAQRILGGELYEFTDTRQCLWTFEYSLTPFEPFIAPKVWIVDNVVLTKGGFGTFTAGSPYIAEDSDCGIYKCGIYYRKTAFIIWQAFVPRS